MSDRIPEYCEKCGASIRDYASVLVWKGESLCGDCYIKAAVDPEKQLERCGGRRERCGASLDQKGMVFSEKDGVMCFDCLREERVANWHKNKLPGAPDACARCGKSFVGSDAAILWEGKAICGECFTSFGIAPTERGKLEIIPLVELGLRGDAQITDLPNWVLKDLNKDLN